jgi:Ca-activated chloride channel family protein
MIEPLVEQPLPLLLQRRRRWKWAFAAVVVVLTACEMMAMYEQHAPPPHRPSSAQRLANGPAFSNFGEMSTTAHGKPVALPLKHTDVHAEIVGVMSAVEVVQHFTNPYQEPIEAVYAFPLPHQSAVHAMSMKIGDRKIEARVHTREEAKQVYEKAKQEGKTTSLLEQERPNIFTQSVANIMPGDQIEVHLHYIEELFPKDGSYEFVFPMVVGPRYVGGGEDLETSSGVGWAEDTTRIKDASRITPPLLEPGLRPGHDISVELRINAGLEIAALESPSHQVVVGRPNIDIADVTLASAAEIPNRDLVVRYRLAGKTPQVALLTNHEKRGAHFLLMVQPQAKMKPAEVAPREYVFVIDTSGSMGGYPLETAKSTMARLLRVLRPVDRFQVIRFDSQAERFAPEPVTPSGKSIAAAQAYVDGFSGGGGTEFLPALDMALNAPRDPARARIVIFMTDGYIGYEAETLRYLRAHLGSSNLFALGVGTSVNRYLIDGMARIGHGEPFVVLHDDEAPPVVEKLIKVVSQPALTNLEIDWGGLPVSDVVPAHPPDLFAERPIVVAGRVQGKGASTVTVRGLLAGHPFEQKVDVRLPDAAEAGQSEALSYLWARRRIGELADRRIEREEDPAIKQEITEIALAYNLMSEFTSFVAVSPDVRNRTGKHATVAIPVPLPEGVGPSAAPPEAYVAAPPQISAQLSTDRVMPGDPEVSIRAPDEATAVTLIFPTGEIKACRYDERAGRWVASFLIPEDTRDGVYVIQVLITIPGGAELGRTVRYQVDNVAPRVTVRATPSPAHVGEKVRIIVEPNANADAAIASERTDIGDPSFGWRITEELATAEAQLPSGETIELERQPDGTLTAWTVAPTNPGRYPIAVVARDEARNKVREILWLTVEAAAR